MSVLAFIVLFMSHVSYASSILSGDDGYRLWLKYEHINNLERRKNYSQQLNNWRVVGDSATDEVIRQELSYGFSSMLGNHTAQKQEQQASLIVANLSELPDSLRNNATGSKRFKTDEDYLIYGFSENGRNKILITGKTDVATLYGSYHLLRLMQTGESLTALNIFSSPKISVRVLNHWDNLDRHVERGYAGQSIWDWHKLPELIYQRYHDYARANASIGINGTVLNNVNSDPLILTPQYLEKVKALAEVFRSYGMKVYLSVKFSSPQLIGGLDTSDPTKPEVLAWWKQKTKEIYAEIPDFGGFLVKANSEGQPGPGDFGRTHAQGANMLAEALAPHDGIVMWRAFVYANEKNEERSKQAYSEFKPLDGKFLPNVLVQVKNGPIDFQPREPISPLFGATPNTPMMMEFQITQEYLGFSTHNVYLGPMYKEVLSTDTYAKGKGSTVAKVVDGSLFNNNISGMAGVSNIGTDRNWTGNVLLQANWYVFGRLAWDHELSSEEIAQEWTKMTLTQNAQAVDKVVNLLMSSRETTVNYMTPLGLHHIMDEGHHYGPGPWIKDLGREDWTSVYYHKADSEGIGFNRSVSGVNAVAQYHEPLRSRLSDPSTTPDEFLLWFHHLPWDYTIKSSGRSLWDELVHRYYQGAREVEDMAQQWNELQPWIDPLLFAQQSMVFTIHQQEAKWWRDACVSYFQSFAKRPIPDGLTPPAHSLDYYQKKQFPNAPGRGD